MSTWNYQILVFLILPCFYILILSTSALTGKNNSKIYLNQYAVHIKGGQSTAKEVAKRYDFVYVNRVGSLNDMYVFEHPKIQKRSIQPSNSHEELSRHPNVLWVEQQHEIKRVKRDFLPRYFLQGGSEHTTEPRFNDPLYKSQWYLHGGAKDGYDMNVIQAWQKGYTGKDIVISILDDGIQRDHPDLVTNYDSMASADINDNDDDPMPRDDGNNKHGTRCAGEVAAMAHNNVCGVGVAYKAKIGGVRMLDGPVSDVVEAQALGLNIDHIDIYSASWGPEDDGKTVDGPGPLAKQAFINGITRGRNGKGAIYIWASGNGGLHKDSCNCDGYTNSIYTLSISSATERGLKPWYLEECASTMATTYSSGESGVDRSVVTTDMSTSGRNLCTEQHTGTSASAPLAAGIVALALEARPDLTWRDIQYLVILTSRSLPLEHESGWITNAMGRKVSYKFGYGLMDAAALVSLAERWTFLPPQKICESRVDSKEKQINDKLVVIMTSNGCAGSHNAIKFLEHVQAKVTLRFPRRGDVKITLISPMGTSSILLPPRPGDVLHDELDNWPLLSVHFWGENPNGEWKLIIEDAGNFKHPGLFVYNLPRIGVLHKWSLIFYGTEIDPLSSISQETSKNPPHKEGAQPVQPQESHENPKSNPEPKQPLPSEGSQEDHRYNPSVENNQCHVECDESGCSGPGANQCFKCKHYKLLLDCIQVCPQKYYSDSSFNCKSCHPLCHTCSGPTESDCNECKPGAQFVGGKCEEICKEGEFSDNNYECIPCSTEDCAYCSSTQCQMCKAGYYLKNNNCLPCHQSCSACTGPTEKNCFQCRPHMFLQNGGCVLHCDENYYLEEDLECIGCHNSCKSCSDKGSNNCLSCPKDYHLSENNSCQKMKTPCNYNEFLNRQGRCQLCFSSCATCSGAEDSDCLTCNENHILLNGKCDSLIEEEVINIDHYGDCLRNQFKNKDGRCESCHKSCLTCKGDSFSDCITCAKEGRKAHLGVCDMSICTLDNKYYDAMSKSCQPCYILCKTCSGPNPTQCLSCDSNAKLHQETKQCLPCCNKTISSDCCSCSDNPGDLCRTPYNLRKIEIHNPVKYHSHEIVEINHNSELQLLQQPTTNAVLFISIFSCVIIIGMFFAIFGILQARSNRKWCWQRGYESLPFKYDATSEGIALTKDLEDDEIFSR